jgi:hypothetical protein
MAEIEELAEIGNGRISRDLVGQDGGGLSGSSRPEGREMRTRTGTPD